MVSFAANAGSAGRGQVMVTLVRRPARSEPDVPAGEVLVGVEHEFIVRAGTEAVDFRPLLHAAAPEYRIDPGDPNAYRLSSALALTSDGREAEFAIPPIPLAPGFTEATDATTTTRPERVDRDRNLSEREPAGITRFDESGGESVYVEIEGEDD